METINIMVFGRPQKPRFNAQKGVYEYYPSSEGIQLCLTYSELVKWLTKGVRCECKGETGAVIFGEFKNGQTHRKQENILNRSCICLEIDGLKKEDVLQMKQGLQSMAYDVIGYSSYNHLADGQTMKLHLIFPFSNPVTTKEHYVAAYEYLQLKFLKHSGFVLNEEKISPIKSGEINIDQSAKSWALVMYLPCVKKGRTFQWLAMKGEFFNPYNEEVMRILSANVKSKNKGFTNPNNFVGNNGNNGVNQGNHAVSQGNNSANKGNAAGYNNNVSQNNPQDKQQQQNLYSQRKERTSSYFAKAQKKNKKPGFIGVASSVDYSVVIDKFNNTYTWQQVMQYFLSDKYIYEGGNRYRYFLSKSSGGMVLLNNDLCYSHHSLDPSCNGKAYSKFWLVCKHNFNNSIHDMVQWIMYNNIVVLV